MSICYDVCTMSVYICYHCPGSQNGNKQFVHYTRWGVSSNFSGSRANAKVIANRSQDDSNDTEIVAHQKTRDGSDANHKRKKNGEHGSFVIVCAVGFKDVEVFF